MSAREFSLQIDRSLDLVDDEINDVIQVIGMYCLRGIVQKSPVDTGRFRGNWIVSNNTPDMSTKTQTDKSGSRVINEGTTKISTFDYKTQSTIYIQNNLPYANRLENGWSKQAPKGMVSITVNNANQKYKDVLVGPVR